MVETTCRDPARVEECMATVFALAIERGEHPVKWELGFFIHRDLLNARRPNFRRNPWEPLESAWGAPIETVTLEDLISLVIMSDDDQIYRMSPKGFE